MLMKVCNAAGCGRRIPYSDRYCKVHTHKQTSGGFRGKRKNKAKYDFYHSPEWVQTSKNYRFEHPLCEDCEEEGIVRACNVTDHMTPIDAGGALYDWDNLRALCHSHHNRKTGREGRAKQLKGINYDPPGLK